MGVEFPTLEGSYPEGNMSRHLGFIYKDGSGTIPLQISEITEPSFTTKYAVGWLLRQFDWGISKIAFDGEFLVVHDHFLHDLSKRVLTLQNGETLENSMRRGLKLQRRIYDNTQVKWPMLDKKGGWADFP